MDRLVHPPASSVRICLLAILFAVALIPAHAIEQVTVAQLQQKLDTQRPPSSSKPMQALRDAQLAEVVGNLILTERLSQANLDHIVQKLQPGPSCRQALRLLADRSAFLDPPADELAQMPPPDADTQQRLITEARSNVIRNLKHLPNFFATRITTRYSGVPADMNRNPLMLRVGVFREGTSSREITFRDGEELIDPMKAKPGDPAVEEGLESWGEFGPQPVMILMDAARGTTEFLHWEKTAAGVLAVFHYVVPRLDSNYEVHYKCPTNEPFQDKPAYHGTFSVDPSTGALMRITLETESQPDDPISHVASIIEYSSFEIGERSYFCPVRSLVTMVEESNGCSTRHHNPRLAQPILMINQTTFTNYHRLGSTMRIVGDGADTPPPGKH